MREFAHDKAQERDSGERGGPADPARREPVRLLAFVEHQLHGAQPKGHQPKAEIVDGAAEGMAKVGRVLNDTDWP